MIELVDGEYWKKVTASGGANEFIQGAINKTQAGIYPVDAAWIVEHVPPNEDDIILDVGCGHGGIAYYYALKCKEVWGVDYEDETEEIKERSKRAGITNYHFICKNAENLDCFEDSKFTKVISCSSLEHSERSCVRRTNKEIYRVLKPGGVYVCTMSTSYKHYYWSENDILEDFVECTDFKLADPNSLTGWIADERGNKNYYDQIFESYMETIGYEQNWITVGIKLLKPS